MFTEDPAIFLADFGVPVTAGAVSGVGIFDAPGEYVLGDRVISLEYGLKVETSKFGNVGYGDVMTINGDAYSVREAPLPIDDGAFCIVSLSKLAPDGVPVLERPIAEVRIDSATAGIIYVGRAINGASESSPIWTITRSTYNAAGIRTGKGTATGAWSNRTNLTYV